MKISPITPENTKKPDYYAIVAKNLKKRYTTLDNQEINTLARELIFAPRSYRCIVKEEELPVTSLRETCADAIEYDAVKQGAIPYSLDTVIADLIEKNSCETSSINEYFRWISTTSEIIQNTTDGIVTKQDLDTRDEFLTMSYDREAELLLCLALYEGAGKTKNKDKIALMCFKLARLREMRSIVRSTPNKTTPLPENKKEELRQKYKYCQTLLAEKNNFISDFNLKLKINPDDRNNDNSDEDFSYLDYIQETILYLMRQAEQSAGRIGQRSPNQKDPANPNNRLSSSELTAER